MTTPKKATEKISLPLIFVTFVVVLLMFAVSPVSAQVCEPGNFCDRDGDAFIRNHHKCENCIGATDCDDDDYDDKNECTTSAAYTATLTGGAFKFVDSEGDSTGLEVTPVSKGYELRSVWDAEMHRPPDTDPNQATWDSMFEIGCPSLGTSDSFKIDVIISTSEDWSIEQYGDSGDMRLLLRDIRVKDFYGDDWQVTVQLIRQQDDPDVDPFLPAAGDPSVFTLDRGKMWGREVRGGPGGRISCQPTYDIFPLDASGASNSVLEIAIP